MFLVLQICVLTVMASEPVGPRRQPSTSTGVDSLLGITTRSMGPLIVVDNYTGIRFT